MRARRKGQRRQVRAGGEARTSVWVGARASWNSCAWEMGPFRSFSILFLFFIYSRGAWRVRGINIFGRFLDSLNFIFFSFVGLLLLLLYKSVIVIVLLFHLFFFQREYHPRIIRSHPAPIVVTPAARRHPRRPPTHPFSTFVTVD